MDIELLKTFLEVRRTRHFGKAAQNLYVTQAAVSARIRQLETLLGVKLFVRTRNNIQLTSEGERLVSHAQTMMLVWSRARQDLALDKRWRNQLSIGVRCGLWNDALQQRLQTLCKKMPKVIFRAESRMLESVVQMLLDRSMDIAISCDPPGLPEFNVHPIGTLNLNLYCTERNATLKAAMQSGYVQVDWGSAFAQFHAIRLGDAAVAPVLRTNLEGAAARFVCSNGGAAFLPRSLAAQYEGKLHRVKDAPEYSRAVQAVYRTNSNRLSLIESVLGALDGLEV